MTMAKMNRPSFFFAALLARAGTAEDFTAESSRLFWGGLLGR
jgi:hypothetical protein